VRFGGGRSLPARPDRRTQRAADRRGFRFRPPRSSTTVPVFGGGVPRPVTAGPPACVAGRVSVDIPGRGPPPTPLPPPPPADRARQFLRRRRRQSRLPSRAVVPRASRRLGRAPFATGSWMLEPSRRTPMAAAASCPVARNDPAPFSTAARVMESCAAARCLAVRASASLSFGEKLLAFVTWSWPVRSRAALEPAEIERGANLRLWRGSSMGFAWQPRPISSDANGRIPPANSGRQFSAHRSFSRAPPAQPPFDRVREVLSAPRTATRGLATVGSRPRSNRTSELRPMPSSPRNELAGGEAPYARPPKGHRFGPADRRFRALRIFSRRQVTRANP